MKNPVEEGVILTAVLIVEGFLLWWADSFQPGELVRLGAFLLVAQQSMPDYLAISNFRLKMSEQVPLLDALADLYSDEGKHIVPSGDRCFEGLREGIDIRGLSFSYQPAIQVLQDIHCSIPSGCTVGLVGESGAGKTTLAHLITRFYDCPPGTLFLDGVDIREFSLPSLHDKLSLVSQQALLLNRSIRLNLTFGLESKPGEESLLRALDDVELGDLVRQLPDGVDTRIGERGVQLSGGQRQRLALARSLLRDPEILILDEATASLDSLLEQKIEATVERRSSGRTLIVIAHRLSTIRNADQILVMSAGRIVERGTWDELVSNRGHFETLYRAQFERESAAAGAPQ